MDTYNVLYFEQIHIETFDPRLGYPNNMRKCHIHVNPACLYDDADSTHHSPIIGFAFEVFPNPAFGNHTCNLQCSTPWIHLALTSSA